MRWKVVRSLHRQRSDCDQRLRAQKVGVLAPELLQVVLPDEAARHRDGGLYRHGPGGVPPPGRNEQTLTRACRTNHAYITRGLSFFLLDSSRVLVGTPGTKTCWEKNTSRIQMLRPFDLYNVWLTGPGPP